MNAIAFNSDGTLVAVCPGTKEIYIMKTNGSYDENKWEEIQALNEHSMPIASIDWNYETNTIVSGSIDRSVFVWSVNEETKTYRPEFVNMDEKLSIIDIKWARNGKKFVSGTSSKQIFIAH